jgi:hypothetical protein
MVPKSAKADFGGASPESITTGWEYGFRARPTQVGLGRLGRLAPISGKPEIGRPSRNDSGEIGATSSERAPEWSILYRHDLGMSRNLMAIRCMLDVLKEQQ